MVKSDYTYLQEKYSTLIQGLIVGEGNAKERLLENSISLHMVFGLTFPYDLEDRKSKIVKTLSKFPALIENEKIILSSYDRSIMKVRKSTASKIINDIYSLYIELKWILNCES